MICRNILCKTGPKFALKMMTKRVYMNGIRDLLVFKLDPICLLLYHCIEIRCVTYSVTTNYMKSTMYNHISIEGKPSSYLQLWES